jgi:hypothetical protein
VRRCIEQDDNMTQLWANALGNNSALGVGMMDTDWDKTGRGLSYTAYVSWNNANASLPVLWERWGERT